jgi:ribonuclease HII
MPRLPRFNHGLLPESPNFEYELALWKLGLQRVAGIDEAGRGALAGPVAAAVVVFRPDDDLANALLGVDDSKRLAPAVREFWRDKIINIALEWGVGLAENDEIDRLGIVPATCLAIRRALEQLPSRPEHLLIDYLILPGDPLPQTPLVKGDRRSLSIAAASILAKTTRDELLRKLDKLYPGYAFARHKGYGTSAHLQVLQRLGPSPVHRLSFRHKIVQE